MIEKVTIFATRQSKKKREILILSHPSAGFQIVAGTVEVGEYHAKAALRELQEESGIVDVDISTLKLFHKEENELANGMVVALEQFTIPFSSGESSEKKIVKRGHKLEIVSEDTDTSILQLRQFQHHDDIEGTIVAKGDVSNSKFSKIMPRYFYSVYCNCEEDEWKYFADGHEFSFFWKPIDEEISVHPLQQHWVSYYLSELE